MVILLIVIIFSLNNIVKFWRENWCCTLLGLKGQSYTYPASRGYIFAVWAVVRQLTQRKCSLCSQGRKASCKRKSPASLKLSSIGAARKVFPHWSQKTITHHCLSLFPIVSRLGYRTNWLLGLGELLHDHWSLPKFNKYERCKQKKVVLGSSLGKDEFILSL